MRKLFNDEAGFVVSAELVLVMTIAVLATVVGLASVKDAVTNELNDLSNAFGAVDQTYNVRGLIAPANGGKGHASNAGYGYNDGQDDCDCKGINTFEVCGKTQSATSEGTP